MSFLNRPGSGSAVDVGTLLGSPAIEYLVSIIEGGALVSLCRTGDGGAFSCTVTVDGEWEREYCRTEEELCDFLKAADTYVIAHPPASPSVRGRKRGR